jgi:hypothetical protein
VRLECHFRQFCTCMAKSPESSKVAPHLGHTKAVAVGLRGVMRVAVGLRGLVRVADAVGFVLGTLCAFAMARILLIRHSPDSRVVERDFPSHRGAPQRNSIAIASARSQIVGSPASQCWNSLLCLHQGASLPSPSVASDPIFRSRRRGWRPQPGDDDRSADVQRPEDVY